MIQKPGRIENFDQLNKVLQDWFSNLGIDDLKAAGIRTEAPTADQLNKGQKVIAEIAGAPWIYYKALDGTLYKKQLDLA